MATTNPKALNVVAIPGSLKRASINRALLCAAAELAPEGLAIRVHGLEEIPLFNEDVEAQGMPAGVQVLRRAAAEADALLIATPEYNHSVPGVLKNAVDWMSRPPKPHPFDGKPVGVLGATPGAFGTRAAQYHLRQTLSALNAYVLPQPQILVRGASQLFDADGRLTDEATRNALSRYLTSFEAWIRRVGG